MGTSSIFGEEALSERSRGGGNVEFFFTHLDAETGNPAFQTAYTIFGFVIVLFAIFALIRG